MIIDWLRGGRTASEIKRGKYGQGMAFAALSRRAQNRILKDMTSRGCTHMMFERALGPYPLWDWTQTKTCTPKELAEAAKYIRNESNLLPFIGPLFSQNEVKTLTLDKLEAMASKHATAWAEHTDKVWVAFEVNESISFKGTKEGMRGDDWVVALLGRMERLFGKDVAVQMTANERHYYTRFESSAGTSKEKPPVKPYLLYQFPWDWDPDLNGNVAYKNEDGSTTIMKTRDAFKVDWTQTITRCKQMSPRQIVIPFEWSSKDPKHTDKEMSDVANYLDTISRQVGLPEYGRGMGTLKN